ncbi:MAG: copper resistance CopC/CopD family protein [Solirubrobacteraceae bacterium]
MPVTCRLPLLLLALAVAAGVACAAPPDALAHAAFVGASPQPGARGEVAPGEVALNFTEPLNRRLTSLKLIAVSSGKQVSASMRTAGASRLLLRPGQTLGTGAYRVEWHTVSTQDGHALEGSFSFGVRAAAAGGEHALEQSPLARDGWLRVLLRALLYASALLFVAALLLPRLVGLAPSWLAPAALGNGEVVGGACRREAALIDDLGWLATGAAVAATLAEAADAAGSLAPAALRDYLLSNQAGVARVAVVVFLAMAALVWRRLPRIAALAGALAFGAIAASGHASSASPRVPSILNDWLHLLSAAAWLGGIGLLALVWARPLRRGDSALRLDVARHVFVPFGRVALPAFVLVSVTGLVSLITQLGHVSALWETDYGRLLTVKVVVVGLIATASAVHALRLRPRLLAHSGTGVERRERRHWRLVRAEPVLGLGVVAVVAFLVAFPLPPRQLGEADEARASAPVCDPCPLPKPAADELPVATRAGSHLVAAWVQRIPTELTGTVRVRDIRGRPARAPLRIAGARQSSCGLGCSRFRAPPSAATLRLSLSERGRHYTAVLPTNWQADSNERARRLLVAAEQAMRRLRSVREVEEVTSGPGSFARTNYRLRAPDRMAYRTDGGVQTVIAGKRRWFRAGPGPWQPGQYGPGLAFRTRSWFRWSTYGRSVRLLGVDRRGAQHVATLALFDEGTPVWFRLRVDLATKRVLADQMTSKQHFTNTRYYAFDQPLSIAVPKGADGG